MEITLNKYVFKFLKEKKLSQEAIQFLLDKAIYFAEQNGTLQASRAGMAEDEAICLASNEVAKFIKKEFGKVEICGKYKNGENYKINDFCYCERK